ncbi:NADH-flavin reductase [Actinorhabdospora filicis]|uniref:NADH-flavin reductase n=1 Tax=Actinorhabdospora filicis TaxID=1785913 RepID=A0A9W6W9D1_9ACTN|nr:NAD(P)-binding oxidoreductase [Actinorhabdospora filicis]GLZ78484.1 NADH-flavin reductase [Actinorhabdospora filicis]
MKLTIFAATGGVGRHLLDQALAAGHDVTAAVRNPAKLPGHPGLRVITADLTDPDPAAMQSAVGGADAVLSVLGPSSNAEAGVAAHGTRAIAEAMRATGVRRLVAISAAPVAGLTGGHDPGDGPFMRHLISPLLRRFLAAHYADLATMETLLRESDLDWTVLRPPYLTDKPRRPYRTAIGRNVRRGMSISRADVAAHMLQVLDRPGTVRQTVSLAY